LNAEIKTNGAQRVQKPKLPKKHKKQSVKFCPKCGSTNVFWASGLPQLWSIWECRNCGYRGSLILEDGKLAEKLRRNYFKKITFKR
jgi:predicted RNA-binding Zn-ribbon protein involved in translation (DUF1610 family)